jgi:death-on-curing protein
VTEVEELPEWLITEERVLELHAKGLDRWGGLPGLKEKEGVARIIGNALQAGFYSPDGSPDILTVASYLLFYFARSQVFNDGNKRVAWMAAQEQLHALEIRTEADDQEAIDFVLDVAVGKLQPEEIADWFTDLGRLRPWTPPNPL